MWREQFLLFAPTLAVLMLLLAFVLYVFYSTDRHYRLKLLLGPALVIASLAVVPSLGAQLGYGWPAGLPVSFEYLAHRVKVEATENRWIDVLVVSRKPFSTEPRLHRVRWSQKLEDALYQAQQMKEGKEGGDIEMNADGHAASNGDSYPSYVPKRVLPRDQSPKPGNSPPRAPDQRPKEDSTDRGSRSSA